MKIRDLIKALQQCDNQDAEVEMKLVDGFVPVDDIEMSQNYHIVYLVH